MLKALFVGVALTIGTCGPSEAAPGATVVKQIKKPTSTRTTPKQDMWFQNTVAKILDGRVQN